MAAELLAECVFHQQVEGTVEVYNFGSPILGKYIAELHVLGRIPNHDSELLEAMRFHDLQVLNLKETFEWLEDDGITKGLEHSVIQKQANLRAYQASAPEVWLVLHDGFAPSSWPPTSKHIRAVANSARGILSASGFSRIYFDSTFDGPIRLFP
jgi:hypothetical protein